MEHRLPVFDGDGHVWEDDDEIAQYLEGSYAHLKRFKTFSLFPSLDGWARGFLANDMDTTTSAQIWSDMLEELGSMGSVLYPTAGLAHGLIQDPTWAAVTATAYNNWLEDCYTSRDPRLFGAGLMAVQDPSAAIAEMRRCVQDRQRFVAMMLPTVTATGMSYGHEAFWPIFEEAQRLGVTLALHGGPSKGMGFDHLSPYIKVHALEHPIPLFIQLTDMVLSGVFEVFPSVRFAFLEGGSSWVPWMMDRLDYEYGWLEHQVPRLGRKPSDYIRNGESFWVSAELDEAGLSNTIDAIGSDRIIYPSDYPHERRHEAFAGDIPRFLDDPRFTDEIKARILHDNAKRLYRIPSEL